MASEAKTPLEKLLELRDEANNGGVPIDVGYHFYVESNRRKFLEGENSIKRNEFLNEKVDAEVVQELVDVGESLQDVQGIEEFERKERRQKNKKEKELKKIKKQKKKLRKKEKKMKKSLEKNELKEKVASELKTKFLLGGDILPTESMIDLVKDGFVKVLNAKTSSAQKREDVEKDEEDSYSHSLSYSSSDDVSPPRSRSASRERDRKSSSKPSPSTSSRRDEERSSRRRSHSPSPPRRDRKRTRSHSPLRDDARKRFRGDEERLRDSRGSEQRESKTASQAAEASQAAQAQETPEELELRSKLLLALLMKQKTAAANPATPAIAPSSTAPPST